MTRKCPECKEKYTPQYTSMQPTCNKFKCMAKHSTKTRVKAEKDRKLKDKAFKQKHLIETTAYQHKLTQPVFNKMRVLEEKLWFFERGIEPYCISCGKIHRTWSCGHLKTVGHQRNLRYDPRNTFLQCWWYCNKNLSGNIEGNKNTHGYKRGLILRFGQEEGQAIIDYCEQTTAPVKWDWYELQEFRRGCNARIRELSRHLEPVTVLE